MTPPPPFPRMAVGAVKQKTKELQISSLLFFFFFVPVLKIVASPNMTVAAVKGGGGGGVYGVVTPTSHRPTTLQSTALIDRPQPLKNVIEETMKKRKLLKRKKKKTAIRAACLPSRSRRCCCCFFVKLHSSASFWAPTHHQRICGQLITVIPSTPNCVY